MLAAILSTAKKDPTYVVGGRLKIDESGAKLGKSDYLIAEADESDGSFLQLFPTIAVITNIENDHLDYYESVEILKEAFEKFCNKVPFYGSVILNQDCEYSRNIIPNLNKRVITYGLKSDALVKAEKIKNSIFGVRFNLIHNRKNHGSVTLNVGGIHNVSNALAAITTAMEIGLDLSLIREGLNRFYLPERRFQVLFTDKDHLVIDDYAHHPTEIKATVETLRTGDFKRIIVVFQPHRFTRLSILMDDFVTAFAGVDLLIISRIYAAGQKKIDNINASLLAEKIKESGFEQVRYVDNFQEIIRDLKNEVRENDAVAFLSAGDLTIVAHQFAKILKSIKNQNGGRGK
jgi:UDP-N-acetylmuramate--alanine ligase